MGTVTFLFTDIEGSTLLLQELGDRYRAVLNQHNEILRESIVDAGGTEVRTEGDSFFVTFTSPVDAVRAVVHAQREFASRDWPHGRALRVRMGLHTGEGAPGGDNYLGIDVNRAARIAAVGWGGQVILSEATKALVQNNLPEGVVIRSLGVHRLKDLRHPEHLYDLAISGAPIDFPSPRSLEVPSNLPLQLTSFVGRKREVADVKSLLAGARLLTVTGPGGTGKTRLALEVAYQVSSDFSDGAFFVDLSSITDPALVVPAIAAALGIREEGWERPVRESLEEGLRYKQLLLVLDNFEQVLEAADVVPQLLAAAPHTKIIVTSRAPLRVRGEQVFPLMPLQVADQNSSRSVAELSHVDAVSLFVQRAAAVTPDFMLDERSARDVADIVERLDGLPLAIELAASRVGIMSPKAILGRLEHRLPFLTGGPRDAPTRQRTLRTTIGWSYELLEGGERLLFRRVAVFTGGSTPEAAARVCLHEGDARFEVLDGLTLLAENSLVVPSDDGDGEVRFGMLQTVREFGLECLEREDDAPAIRRRHAAWFLQLAETAEANLRGPQLELWLGRLQLEHENIRAALRWAIESDEGDVALRLVAAVWRFWHLAGHLSEGRRWADSVLALPSAAGRTMARARALAAAGGLAYWQNDAPSVRGAYEEALSIGRELGDERAIAEGTYNLAFAHGLSPTHDRSRELFLESRKRFESLDSRLGAADSLWALAMMARLSGDFETARARADKSVRLLRELGDPFGLIDALGELGRAAVELGDYDVARESFLETLDALEPIGYRTAIAITLESLAELETKLGHPIRALRLAGAAEALKVAAGGQVPPEFAALSDLRSEARASLSDDGIASAWEEGRKMSLGEAVAYARDPDA